MNIHQNARLTPLGRAVMVARIEEQGWSLTKAAWAAGLSGRNAGKWPPRYRGGDEPRLHDVSSAPPRCPRKVPADLVERIEALRR